MKSNTINIIGPVRPKVEVIDEKLFTIFVDGGLSHKTEKFNYFTSIGDNDSCGDPVDIKLNPDKNRGDLYHAVEQMRELNSSKALLYGFIGGRMDHQLLLLGDLLELAQEQDLSFTLYEQDQIRMEIRPPGRSEFSHIGAFSVFTAKSQNVLYQGDCTYPKDKEYPQLIKPFSTLGLSNFSHSEFQLESEGSFCVFYVP